MKLDSENQIKLDQKLINNLLCCYGLSLVNFKEFKTGVENISALVKTDKEILC